MKSELGRKKVCFHGYYLFFASSELCYPTTTTTSVTYTDCHVRMTTLTNSSSLQSIRYVGEDTPFWKPVATRQHLHIFPLVFFALKYFHLFHSPQAFAKMTFYAPSISVFMWETSRILASISKNFYVSPSPHSVHMTERYSFTSRRFSKVKIFGVKSDLFRFIPVHIVD